MFQLSGTTDAQWAEEILAHLDEVLLEHAHLERKAAQTALQLMVRYPERAFLQRPLSELAREELAHFEGVLAILRRRGGEFGPQKASPYAGRLLALVRPTEPGKLIDRLLCAAVIEARSCERLKLLARAFEATGSELAAFYGELSVAEARHYTVYVEFARTVGAETGADIDGRLQEICRHEAEIVATAPQSPRLHNRRVAPLQLDDA